MAITDACICNIRKLTRQGSYSYLAVYDRYSIYEYVTTEAAPPFAYILISAQIRCPILGQ